MDSFLKMIRPAAPQSLTHVALQVQVKDGAHVVKNRQRGKQADVLECARDAPRRDLIWFVAEMDWPSKTMPPAVG